MTAIEFQKCELHEVESSGMRNEGDEVHESKPDNRWTDLRDISCAAA
jgi:hypothetical protein